MHLELSNVYKILVAKRKKKKSLLKPRHRWEDNIKIDNENGNEC
jgi:hypothetical protein